MAVALGPQRFLVLHGPLPSASVESANRLTSQDGGFEDSEGGPSWTQAVCRLQFPGARFVPLDILDIAVRLGVATLVGVLLGLNRDLHGKSTGVRTHVDKRRRARQVRRGALPE